MSDDTKQSASGKEIRRELNALRREAGMIEYRECSAEEKQQYLSAVKNGEPLPQEIKKAYINGVNEFSRRLDCGLSAEEKMEYLALKQAKDISTIKKCVIFFTVLAAISIAISVIYGLSVAIR